jgi:hypothetical protein
VTEPTPRFDFYEIVHLSSESGRNAELNGQTGAVIGRALSDDGLSWSYAVHVYSTGTSSSFDEDELSPTGRHAKREDFYDGSSIRVILDEKGRRAIAPE